MTFVPFTDGIEVVLQFRMGGQQILNVLNFVNSVTPTVTILEDLAVAIIDAFTSSDWWSDILSNQLTFESVKATSLVSSTAPSVVETVGTSVSLPLSPPSVGDALSNNVALVVTERTDNRGRSYRGRNYLAGMGFGAALTPVEVTATTVTDALALFSAIHAEAITLGATPSVFSRESGGVIRTTGVATPITSIACNPALDSQRRRLQGRGS